MEDFDDISQHVTYGYFYIENYENNYRLHVDQFSGDAGLYSVIFTHFFVTCFRQKNPLHVVDNVDEVGIIVQ